MSKKEAMYSSLLVTVGILYLVVVAAKLGPVIPLTMIGMTCFLMAKIIPGEFRRGVRTAAQEAKSSRRTWFEE